MANGILKEIAVAAGTSLAMGLTSGRTRVHAVPYAPSPANCAGVPDPSPAHPEASELSELPDEEFLNIEPLLDRLERLEAQVETIGEQPPPIADREEYAARLADLERRVEENTRDLALLREQITHAERRVGESAASVERKVEQTRAEMPALVEQLVTARVEDLRSRFSAEIEQSQKHTIEMFERAIDEKISTRMGAIERALAEQAGSIEALNARSTETDNNLQRLVTAIEKLCERAQLIAPAPDQKFGQQFGRGAMPVPPQPRQFEARLPFESQLDDAMQREPVVPVVRTAEPVVEVKAPAFAASAEKPVPAKKSRFFFRNMVFAGFSLLASRLLR